MKFLPLILVLFLSCKPSAPVSVYYLGFKPTGKSMQVAAMPVKLKGWVILDSVIVKNEKQ